MSFMHADKIIKFRDYCREQVALIPHGVRFVDVLYQTQFFLGVCPLCGLYNDVKKGVVESCFSQFTKSYREIAQPYWFGSCLTGLPIAVVELNQHTQTQGYLIISQFVFEQQKNERDFLQKLAEQLEIDQATLKSMVDEMPVLSMEQLEQLVRLYTFTWKTISKTEDNTAVDKWGYCSASDENGLSCHLN